MYDALKAKLAEQGLQIDQTKLTNRAEIVTKLTTALTDNKTYLALTPTVAQNTAQLKAITRQNNKLIRLVVNLLDATV
jgi:outer membrane protein TolC